MTPRIATTRRGKPAMWVGGGALTNTAKGTFVLTHGHLPLPLIIRRRGHLATSPEQALVPLRPDDLVVSLRLSLDTLDQLQNPEAPVSGIAVWRFTGTGLEPAPLDPVLEWFTSGPQDEVRQVLAGLRAYHNRDGSYFVKEPL